MRCSEGIGPHVGCDAIQDANLNEQNEQTFRAAVHFGQISLEKRAQSGVIQFDQIFSSLPILSSQSSIETKTLKASHIKASLSQFQKQSRRARVIVTTPFPTLRSKACLTARLFASPRQSLLFFFCYRYKITSERGPHHYHHSDHDHGIRVYHNVLTASYDVITSGLKKGKSRRGDGPARGAYDIATPAKAKGKKALDRAAQRSISKNRSQAR